MVVKNTFKNLTKEEQIQILLKICERLNYNEEVSTNEKNSNILQTKHRQKRQY